jgi:lambda family phage portal protein
MQKPVIRTNFIDRAVEFINPIAATARYKAKANLARFRSEGYVIPGSSKKSMKGVIASANSVDKDTLPKLKGSRALSRDMFTNTPMMASIMRRARTNIVGPGLMLQSRIDYKFLGITEDEAKIFQSNVERYFDIWASSLNACYSGNMNFYESQGLAAISTLMNGDAFYMLPWKKPKGPRNWPFELRVKLIEADLVIDPKGSLNTTMIDSSYDTGEKIDALGGVEMDKKTGEVLAYHVAKAHPTNLLPDTTRIPIYNRNGDRQIWQIIDAERIGQRRGMPWAAPILDGLKQISRLTEAELMHAIVSSFFTVLIKDNSNVGSTLQQAFTPEESVTGGGGYGPNAESEEKNSGDEFDLEMGYGNMYHLGEGQEAQVLDPVKTDESFGTFTEAISTQLAAACEIPIEQVMLLFKSSYTAARAALLEGFKMWKTKRTWLSRRYCQVVYEEFVSELVIKGIINAPGFFDDALIKSAWCGSAWIGQGMGQLNPFVETKAAELRIRSNLSSYETEHLSMYDTRWDTEMERLSGEKKLLKELSLEKEEALPQPVEPSQKGDIDNE